MLKKTKQEVELDLNEIFGGKNMLDPVNYQYMSGLSNRILILNGEVTNDIVETAVIPLLKWEAEDKGKSKEDKEPITIYLNSVGGSVYDGFTLCDVISKLTIPTKVVTLGYAYSMGGMILISGAHNDNVTRYAFSFSTALIHAGDSMIGGDTNAIRDYFDFSEKYEKKIKNFLLSNTNITKEEYDKMFRHQWYMDSDTMLEKGLIDKIVTDLSEVI